MQLELKIPPPVVWLASGAIAVALARGFPAWTIAWPGKQALAVGLALAGIALGLLGLAAFHAARTTMDPHRPGQSTTLVTGGVYRFSRNPMYLGLMLCLLAVAAWLSNPAALAAVVLFWAWMNRFQIRPEERVLERLFGADYASYRGRVRRWL